MKLNHEKLYNDLNSEIANQETTANQMCQKIGASYGVYVSIREGQDIRTGNLLKLISWLDRPITDYIIDPNKKDIKCTKCQAEINYVGICEICYTKSKL